MMIDLQTIPDLTAAQMAEVDRLMVDVYKIQLLQMMENAGRQLAVLAGREFAGELKAGKRIAVLAGSGGNGGGALACARNLLNWGFEVEIYLSKPPEQLSGAVLHQARILGSYPVVINTYQSLGLVESPGLVIDGILGYGLRGKPRGSAAEMIRWAAASEAPILSLDVPSGLDPTTGQLYQPGIRASATMTLALPKVGLRIAGKDIVGELFLADIGVPPELFARPALGLRIGPFFREEQILHLPWD
jgi:NAD(P)H-hydrate epimerase